MTMIDVENLYARQFEVWGAVRENYAKLQKCVRKKVTVNGVEVSVRFNPERIRSSAADISKSALEARPCFLCQCNRPAQQLSLDWNDYEILVNPYPVFDRHLTIPLKEHRPQRIAGRTRDMLLLAVELPGMTVFYNGPRSGASAPDHFHFQAVPSSGLPLWCHIDAWPISGAIVLRGTDVADVSRRIEGLLIGMRKGEEPDVNIYARYVDGGYEVVVIPRKSHRPLCYGAGRGQVLVSPASLEMAGVIIAPRSEDVEYCSEAENLARIYECCGYPAGEVGLDRERVISVGIVKAGRLKVDFNGAYTYSDGSQACRDVELKALQDGKIECCGKTFLKEILFSTLNAEASFTLHDVMIGIGFHWQQHEDQSFHGNLAVRWVDGMLQAVNYVPLETYLRSVVSSEMNANAPEEFLKAHAVISRSWVLAQMEPPMELAPCPEWDGGTELVKWYDHDAHKEFDVCADDHCQRYQGCTKASTVQVERALDATRGQVLAYDNNLCDARFSKCCGGKTEIFSTCWQNVNPPYLASFEDPYCGRATGKILSTVLNNYDQVTGDYYRWTVTYTAEELAGIIRERSGVDYGMILEIKAVHRGPSGRIDRLKITGTKKTFIIGKELEIRRTLSMSHLYSSAFIVVPGEADSSGVPSSWTFNGIGWGHGVGLCQIGAAVMASEGYGYEEILEFYFPGSRIVKLY